MDFLSMIYNALMDDEYISSTTGGRIKYYEFPETGDVTAPYIIIDPLDVPLPKNFADNTWLTWDCLYQVEVWSKSRATTRDLSERVSKVLWRSGFSQGSGVDEWDKDTGIFRNARRYSGVFYRNDITI
ncbi:DUF3168 domain-containing protein [Heyndrickxia faecalis]|uniref:DUF3168 domain-containing protein n=1 Tax=Heyndrickxia faecalis TaxID=2824910 RepID=UPI003D1E48EE